MALQLGLTGAIIAVSAAYVGWSAWRTWFPPAGKACGGCGSGCGARAKTGEPTFVPAEGLGILRR